MIGIYGIFRKADDKCMYVGESKDINGRIKAHLNGHTRNTFSKDEYYGDVIEEHMINNKQFRLEREAYWIEQLNPELNEVRNRHQSEELKDKNRQTHLGEKNPMFGKYHLEDSKKKMKENHADLSGEKNGMFGKNYKWINNGETTKRINQDELDKYIRNGWRLGRLSWKRNL